MRVLHLIPTLGAGGAERQLAYLCEGLTGVGCHAEVGLLLEGPNLERIQRAGVEIHRLRARSHLDPFLFAHVIDLIRRVRPRVVQTWIPVMDVVGGAAALCSRVPWVLSERSAPHNFAGQTKIRVRARLARRAAAVVSNSPGGDAYWAERLPSGVRHRVIPNAVPLGEIDSTEPIEKVGFGLRESQPLLLYVGRLEPLKNVDVLLEAFRRVVAQASCVALLCGQGPRRRMLEARIRASGLEDRIACAGVVPNVPAYLRRASVFVSLSRYEGMPNAVLEAMAAGCPMVLSDIPAHRDLVGDGAFWVDGDDLDAVVAAILRTLEQPKPASARVAAARRLVEGRSISAAAQSYLNLYLEVAG